MPNSGECINAYEFAEACRKAQEFGDAIKWYNKAIQLGNEFIEEWHRENQGLLGNLWNRLGEFLFNRKLGIEKIIADSHIHIMQTYCDWAVDFAYKGRFSHAESRLKDSGVLDNHNVPYNCKKAAAKVFSLRASREMNRQNFEVARQKMESALKYLPGDPELNRQHAVLLKTWGEKLLKCKQYSQSVTKLEEALGLAPKDTEIQAKLSCVFAEWSQRLIEKGRHLDALDKAKNAVRLASDNVFAIKSLAYAYITLGYDYDAALEALENAYRIFSEDHSVVKALADIYIARDSAWSRASPVIYQAYKMFPDKQEYVLFLTQGYLERNGLDDKAREVYEAAYAIIPLWKDLILAMSSIYAQMNTCTTRSISIMEESLRYRLNDRGVLELLTKYYLDKRKGSFREVKVLARVTQWRSDDFDLFLYLAGILRFHNKLEQAARWYEEVIVRSPHHVEAWTGLADVYAKLGRHADALHACNTVLEQVPDYGNMYLIRGEVFHNIGEHEKARSDYEKASKFDPLSRQAYDRLGEIVATAGEYRSAINYYEHILQMNSRDSDAAYKAGMIVFSAGEYGKAVEFLIRASRIDSKRLDIKILLGRALLASGRASEAAEIFDSTKDNPRLSPEELEDCLFYLGLAHLELENFEKAQVELENLLQIGETSNIPAVINLGVAYARNGHISKSRQLFAEALDIDPYSPIANTNFALSFVKEGRPSYAIRHCMSSGFQTGDIHSALLIASSLFLKSGQWTEMDQAAQKLYRIAYSPSGGDCAVQRAFLAGIGGYLCGRAGDAVERFLECSDILWGTKELSLEMKTLDIWSSALLTLAEYEISTDYDSAYENVRSCIDNDPAICDFVMQKLCSSLGRLDGSGEIEGELRTIAQGTQFGKKLSQETPEFDTPSVGMIEDFLVEEEIARYRGWLAVGPVMEGGMATVERVYNSKLKIFGARKKLKPALVTQSLSRNGFRQEAHLCANLRHPNIVRVFPESIDDREFSFVMEWMDGGSLALLLKQRTLPVEEALRIMILAGEGLTYFHRLDEGNIHRDFTPGNILLDGHGNAKVTDFGVARIRDHGREFTMGDDEDTAERHMVGKYPYMAPEQWQDKALDQKADQYSFGVTFYQLLTGRLPLEPENPGSVPGWCYVVLNEVPRQPNKVREDIPQNLSDAVMRMLAKDPSERFGSMDEVIKVLSNILAGLPQSGGG